MPKTSKGYIAPLLMIFVLLGLAGFVIFAGERTEEQPVVRQDPTPVQAQQPVEITESVGDEPSDTADEPAATTTASTTVDIEAGLE